MATLPGKPLVLALALALTGAATASTAGEAPALTGWLEARERGGCGGGEVDETLRTRFEGTQAIFEQDIWLSTRESLDPVDIVDIAREGDVLSAEVRVRVAPLEEGHPVPACIRPVHLTLRVDGLPPGDYRLRLRQADP